MVQFCRLGLSATLLLGMVATSLAAPWTGGRGPGNRGAFPDINFPQTPATVWKSFLGQDLVGLPPSNALVTQGNVVVAYGPHLIALNAETGELRWHVQMSETPLGDILLLDDQIIITLASGLVVAYSPADGKQLWRQDLPGGLRNGPVYTDEALFFTTRSNTIEGIARRTDGKRIGSLRLPGKVEAAPALLGKSFVVCYYDGSASRVEDGQSKWTARIPNAVLSLSPVTDGKSVFANTSNTIIALNPGDSMKPVRWSYPAPDRLSEPVTLDKDRVYFATRSGKLVALDAATGRDLWTTETKVTENGKEVTKTEKGQKLPAIPVANPAVFGKSLLVTMESGLIGLFSKETGKLEWLYRLRPPLNVTAPDQAYAGGMAVDGDQLYFGGSDGNVYRMAGNAPDVDAPSFREALPKVPEQGFVAADGVKYIGAIIEDEGTGLQPTSVTMRLDRKDLTASMQYDPKTGYYFVGGTPETALEPGMHRLVMTAKDFRGNTGTFALNFILGTETSERMPVTIGGEFLPKHLKVKPGTIVSWKNTSGAPRTVIADNGDFAMSSDAQYPDGIPQGETWVWIIPQDMEFGTMIYYHDRLNGKPGDGTKFGTGLVGLIEIADPNATPVPGPDGMIPPADGNGFPPPAPPAM